MPRPRTHDDDLRRQLIEAASEAIAADGIDGLSLRSIAARAGTSTTAVYSLFGSRESLVDAVAQEGFRRFAAHLDRARGEDPRAALFSLGLAYRANALDNPHFYRVMFGQIPAEASPKAAEGTFGVLVDAVAAVLGVDSPDSRGRDVDDPADRSAASAAARRLWAYVHGLVTLELAGLITGDPDERDAAYREALGAGSWLLDAR